jgi:hypothetical protein
MSFPLLCAALQGEFYVNGEWVNATLCGASVGVGKDGNVLGHSDNQGTYPFKRPPGKASFLLETEIVFSDANGVEITSAEELDMSIYDVSGRCMYSASGQNSLSVDRRSLPNGQYILHLVNKEGETAATNFIFRDGAVMSSPTK